MKRALVFFLFLFGFNVYALDSNIDISKTTVELVNCESADSMWISINGNKDRIHLIAYDKEDGSYNKDINTYTCDLLSNAQKIEIATDPSSNERDNYNRLLVWLWVDGELLQEKLISQGYGQVNYINGDYYYLEELCNVQKNAINDHLGIWQYDNIEEKYCNSGIEYNGEESSTQKEIADSNSREVKKLWYLVFLNSGVLLLSLVLFATKRGSNEKR